MSDDTKIDSEKYLKFRNTSIYFYMFSFFCITSLFIIYLYASKNNRSCQYGSTLFCNTEQKYPLAPPTNNNLQYNELTFNYKYTTPIYYTVQYPYLNGNFDIVYHFGTSGGSNVDIIADNIGLSLNGIYGASIYFQYPTNNINTLLASYTLLILNNSDLNLQIGQPINNGNDIIEYTYKNYTNNDLSEITTNSVFAKAQQVNYQASDPISDNWLNLLKNNQLQHQAGCSSNNTNACACIDPSYITQNTCDNYVLNKTSGLYCPPDNLNCIECTSDTINENNCGFKFCRASNYNVSSTQDASYQQLNKGNLGFYQSTYVPGFNKQNEPSYYKKGINGPLLTDLLGVTIDSSNPANTVLNQYATLQNLNFCAGSLPTLNNINDGTIGTDGKAEITNANTNPLFAKYPVWDSNKKFDF